MPLRANFSSRQRRLGSQTASGTLGRSSAGDALLQARSRAGLPAWASRGAVGRAAPVGAQRGLRGALQRPAEFGVRIYFLTSLLRPNTSSKYPAPSINLPTP